jgi:hypothetical protein
MSGNYLDSISVHRRTGTEHLHRAGEPLGATLLHFWQWSASDLVSNTCRSVVAESIVALDLGLADSVRAPWFPFDFETRSGIKVEVKAAAYLQRWKQRSLSVISFDVPRTRAEDPETAEFASERKRQADVYVFALLAHTDKTTLDPLDVAQWTFFVLPTAVIDRELGEKRCLALARLRALGAREVVFSGIAAAVGEAFGVGQRR